MGKILFSLLCLTLIGLLGYALYQLIHKNSLKEEDDDLFDERKTFKNDE